MPCARARKASSRTSRLQFEFAQIKEKCAGFRAYWALDGQETLFIDIHGVGTLRQRQDQVPLAYHQTEAVVDEAIRLSTSTCLTCSQPASAKPLGLAFFVTSDEHGEGCPSLPKAR
jgi:hypothetical protein